MSGSFHDRRRSIRLRDTTRTVVSPDGKLRYVLRTWPSAALGAYRAAPNQGSRP